MKSVFILTLFTALLSTSAYPSQHRYSIHPDILISNRFELFLFFTEREEEAIRQEARPKALIKKRADLAQQKKSEEKHVTRSRRLAVFEKITSN